MYEEPARDSLRRLENPEYAQLYGEECAKTDFAITLTKARRSLNLTQKELAAKLEISQPYIAKLEGGEANPTLSRIGRLLAIMNLRLVTRTAPLKPMPIIPYLYFTGIKTADAIDPIGAFFSANSIPRLDNPKRDENREMTAAGV